MSDYTRRLRCQCNSNRNQDQAAPDYNKYHHRDHHQYHHRYAPGNHRARHDYCPHLDPQAFHRIDHHAAGNHHGDKNLAPAQHLAAVVYNAYGSAFRPQQRGSDRHRERTQYRG